MTYRLGTGKWLTFFLQCIARTTSEYFLHFSNLCIFSFDVHLSQDVSAFAHGSKCVFISILVQCEQRDANASSVLSSHHMASPSSSCTDAPGAWVPAPPAEQRSSQSPTAAGSASIAAASTHPTPHRRSRPCLWPRSVLHLLAPTAYC